MTMSGSFALLQPLIGQVAFQRHVPLPAGGIALL